MPAGAFGAVAGQGFARTAKVVAFAEAVRQSWIMAGSSSPPGGFALQAAITVAVAAVLVGATTLLRAALTPQLGALSPFMLYVAAVLVAGLVRGPFCGALVMLAGGLLGFRLFLSHHGVTEPGSVVALMIFWGVSAPVLVTANELRVQLKVAMQRLSAALQRNGPAAR